LMISLSLPDTQLNIQLNKISPVRILSHC